MSKGLIGAALFVVLALVGGIVYVNQSGDVGSRDLPSRNRETTEQQRRNASPPPGRQRPPDTDLAAEPAGGQPPEQVQGRGRENQAAKEPQANRPNIGRASDEDMNRLAEKARRDGKVRVIVAMNVDVQPANSRGEAQRNQVRNTREELYTELGGRKFEKLAEFEEAPYVVLEVDEHALEGLRRSGRVAHISEDEEAELPDPDVVDVAGTSSNTSLTSWWDHYRTQTDWSWYYGWDGRYTYTAILDTGVQRNHPYFQSPYGRVIYEACYASSPAGCPNGTSSQTGYGAATPCVWNPNACNHGTHVAGIAAGQQGVARYSNIIAVNVFHNSNGTPRSWTSDQLKGLEYVYNLRMAGVAVGSVNLSLGGGGPYSGYCDSYSSGSFWWWVQKLRDVGVPTVVAAGNDGFSTGLASPACTSNVISVGNSTLDTSGYDAVYSGSNSASYVTMWAPGTSICSSVNNGGISCGYTGTSMAAPQVAGTLSVMKSMEPYTSVTSSVTALQNSGAWLQDSRNSVWKRRLSVYDAVYKAIYTYN